MLKPHKLIETDFSNLVRSKTVRSYMKYFHLAADLCQLYRSTSSILNKGDGSGATVDISEYAKPYTVRTTTLPYRPEERP